MKKYYHLFAVCDEYDPETADRLDYLNYTK